MSHRNREIRDKNREIGTTRIFLAEVDLFSVSAPEYLSFNHENAETDKILYYLSICY